MDSAYKKLLKVTTLFGSVQGLNILMNLLRAKLAAMLLGPAGIGLNSIYNETREFIHSTTNLGMDQSGTREIAKSTGAPDLADSVMLTRSWIMLLAAFGMLATAVFAYPLSWMLFSDGDHTWQMVALSPAVAFSTLTCGEMTVLRGLQQMKTIAGVSVLHVFLGVITTIPLYYIWGMDGIIGALVLMTLSLAIVTMIYSYRIHPPKFCFCKDFLYKGKSMLQIGVSFMLAAVVAHVAMLIIQGVLNRYGGIEVVGYYNSAYSICFVYVGILFASLSQEYFPRLSSLFRDKDVREECIKRQMNVVFLLSVPLTVIMYLLMPWIVILLLSEEFLPVITIAQAAIITLPCRAIYLPLAYIPLAAGDSKLYFCMELISYIIMVVGVLGGFHYWGLEGVGYGFAIVNIMDMLCNLICVRLFYKLDIKKLFWH
jgi:O-antigen/teichoic acid export membrane protein